MAKLVSRASAEDQAKYFNDKIENDNLPSDEEEEEEEVA